MSSATPSLSARPPLPSSRLVLPLVLLVSLTPSLFAQVDSTAARAALLEGRIGDAIQLLDSSPNATRNPADELLLCRGYHAEDRFDDAIAACELASSAPSPAGDAFLWLGRAYGAKAGRANPFSAFVLARKVHAAFARAVELDSSSVPALNDLGEFCVKAPAVVGGGLDQARSVAAQAAAHSQMTQHRLLGLIAGKEKDPATAEREFKTAIAVAAPAELAGAHINLAQFYQLHDRDVDAVTAVKAAIAADHAHGPSLVDAASILSDLHREPALAIRCLEDYLVSPARSDAAPAFKVRLQLADLLAAAHDSSGARRERAAALALAPNFAPARKLSQAASQSQQVR